MPMTDDRTKRDAQDPSRISLKEDYEIVYWTARFGVTREQLAAAVNTVGHSATAVAKYIKGSTAQ